MTAIAVAVGGAAGASARYGVGRAIPTPANAFPWATLLVNIGGCVALGALVAMVPPAATRLRAFVGVGFLGGFTTYSTFAVQTDHLVQHGHAATALTYVVASIAIGVAAVGVGMRVAMRVARR